MFPIDGSEIRVERIEFVKSTTFVKISVVKDKNVVSLHIVDPDEKALKPLVDSAQDDAGGGGEAAEGGGNGQAAAAAAASVDDILEEVKNELNEWQKEETLGEMQKGGGGGVAGPVREMSLEEPGGNKVRSNSNSKVSFNVEDGVGGGGVGGGSEEGRASRVKMEGEISVSSKDGINPSNHSRVSCIKFRLFKNVFKNSLAM